MVIKRIRLLLVLVPVVLFLGHCSTMDEKMPAGNEDWSFIVIGDTAGAIIGRIWGKVRFRDKSLEGSVSFLVACLLAGIVIPAIPFWVKIVGAITATIVEAITLHIDDNLIVPVTSGAIMQVIVSQMVILKYFS